MLHRPECLHAWLQAAPTGGYAAKDQEFQGERCMQLFKTEVGRRVCQHPEMTYCNSLLLASGLRSLLADNVDKLAKLHALAKGTHRAPGSIQPAEPAEGSYTDSSSDGAFGQYYHMIGRGQQAVGEFEESYVEKGLQLLFGGGHNILEPHWQWQEKGGWVRDCAAAAIKFNEAMCGPFRICVAGKGRARTRANYFVQVGTAHRAGCRLHPPADWKPLTARLSHFTLHRTRDMHVHRA